MALFMQICFMSYAISLNDRALFPNFGTLIIFLHRTLVNLDVFRSNIIIKILRN